MREVVRVALPVPIDSLFDYSVPEALSPGAVPGCRVLVPFSGRPLTGVIVARLEGAELAESSARTLSELASVLDASPVVSPEMIGILREAAADVLCPVGLALAAALPPGSAPRIQTRFELTARGREALRRGAVSGAPRTVLEALSRGPLGNTALAKRMTDPASARRVADLVRELNGDGLVARTHVTSRPIARAATETFVRLAEGVDVDAACHSALSRAPAQAAMLRRIAEACAGAKGGEVRTADLRSEAKGAGAALRALLARGLALCEQRAAPRDLGAGTVPRDSQPELSADQIDSLAAILASIRGEEGKRFLLQGVTGSGKTEVYLSAVAETIALGKQALVLVPEIMLTHQIVRSLRARFGDALAVLHSGLRPGERLEQWQRLQRGDTPIAVGARSALFAPLERLGLIAIDEEHDSAYKNDEGFRYHARDLARRRAKASGCTLILGSATPSLETRHAADSGKLTLLSLPRRIGDRPLPAVELVDLARERERAPRGRKIILTQPLRKALKQTLLEGGQSILFLNRRGFSTKVMCFDCGHAEHCKNCEVALVYHATEQRLRCHYCDYNKPPSDNCEGCGAPDTALLGVGTQRLEEEVRGFMPGARLARLDRDTARRRGYTESVLAGLRAGEIDILIGTQMVAKGHDFPGVRLVGVIMADLGLHMPDFRAAERTFQLLTQVAGRAGRAAAPGRVIVQSFVPNHYAIRAAQMHDFEAFYAEEIEQRASLGYPPFGHLAHLVISTPDETQARETTESLAGALRQAIRRGETPPVEVLGPAPSPLPRLRGKYRFQLLIKAPDEGAVHAAARQLADRIAKLPRAVQASLDVNPGNML